MVNFSFENEGAEIFIPDGRNVDDALGRVTHMAIGAHQDDLEFGAISSIGKCFFSNGENHFAGITVTNGSGSPLGDGPFKTYTSDQMSMVRRMEQREAARRGQYSAQIQLSYPSSDVKSGKQGEKAPKHDALALDIFNVLMSTKEPLEVLEVHNPFDKHETHNAVTRATIEAVRMMPPEKRPKKIVGYEIWRGLDWVPDEVKKDHLVDVSKYTGLQQHLMECFESQIAGGKRYDVATLGRQSANATYFESHDTDKATHVCYKVDMTDFVKSTEKSLTQFTQEHIDAFAKQLLAKSKQYEPQEIAPPSAQVTHAHVLKVVSKVMDGINLPAVA